MAILGGMRLLCLGVRRVAKIRKEQKENSTFYTHAGIPFSSVPPTFYPTNHGGRRDSERPESTHIHTHIHTERERGGERGREIKRPYD